MSARRRSRGTPRSAKTLEETEATCGVQEEEAAEGGPGAKESGAAAQCGRLTVAEWQQRGDHEAALLPRLCRGDLAQLSVATMTQRRLSIGRPALLCSPHAQTVCVVWPASGVPTGRIRLQPRALASLRITPGQEVCVQPITRPMLPAQLLELVTRHGEHHAKLPADLPHFIMQHFEGKVLLPRNALSFNYFGRPYDLQVVAVRGQGGGAEKDVAPNYPSCFEAEPRGSNSSGRSPPLQQEVPVTGVPGPVNASSEREEGVPASDENAFERNICARLMDMALQTSPETSWSPDSKADAAHPPPGSDASPPPRQDAALDVVKTAPCFCVKFHVGDLFCISKGTRVKVELGNAPSTTVPQQQQRPVTYADIGGLGPQLQAIREDIELPLLHPEVFTQLGVCPPRGVILHGSPGTGKTMIARAVAHETRAHFYLINGPEIFNRFYGESEARLRKVFQEASMNPPALVFIDELDALCPARGDGGGGGDDVGRRVVATLLTLMDGLGSERSRGQLLVLAATNRLHAIDPALRRPGRFDRELEVPPPDATGRRAILERLLGRPGLPHVVTGPEVAALARATHAYTGADLTALLKEGGGGACTSTVRRERASVGAHIAERRLPKRLKKRRAAANKKSAVNKKSVVKFVKR
uniref:ATPase family protein 2 homolog n=1 Tax=Petromyzon marinus TaxID=7757 RepID=A0AAJ7TBR9_PETMA|nr:ATPase family protein 2 homolog [Petromyzon marinus]